MYLPCFMLVYSIYCIVVSSLLFSPSTDKPCTCNMSPAPPASISLLAICGWESNVISYISNFTKKIVVVAEEQRKREREKEGILTFSI